MISKEERRIINRLRAQKDAVRPSRALLERILLQLSPPATSQSFSFWLLRIAIPAGVAVLVGVIFLQIQKDPAQITPTLTALEISQQAQISSVDPLTEEENAVEQIFTQQESFFEDESLIKEVTLSDF